MLLATKVLHAFKVFKYTLLSEWPPSPGQITPLSMFRLLSPLIWTRVTWNIFKAMLYIVPTSNWSAAFFFFLTWCPPSQNTALCAATSAILKTQGLCNHLNVSLVMCSSWSHSKGWSGEQARVKEHPTNLGCPENINRRGNSNSEPLIAEFCKFGLISHSPCCNFSCFAQFCSPKEKGKWQIPIPRNCIWSLLWLLRLQQALPIYTEEYLQADRDKD